MSDASLSEQQLKVLERDVELVEACPGAGKTRAIIARFQKQSLNVESGVALLSFTNAAVDEATKRSSETPSILYPPNFVGTLDGFLHRFIITPWYRREFKKTPTYLNSWNDLSESRTEVRIKTVTGSGIQLSSFSPNVKGELEYSSEPTHQESIYIAQMANSQPSYSITDMVPIAAKMVERLTDVGIYDCDHARVKALHLLNGADVEWLKTRLKNRFSEIIIDEFQDCSIIEHGLIAAFKKIGIKIVVVADPDQSIYAFRRATPLAFSEYKSMLGANNIVSLNENYRSSVAICEVVSSMRTIGSDQIKSVADFVDLEAPSQVVVAVGSEEFQRRILKERSDIIKVPGHERIVLSATRKGASRLSGEPYTDKPGKGSTGRLLRNLALLNSSKSVSTRKDVTKSSIKLLLKLFKWDDSFKNAKLQDYYDALGITEHEINGIIRKLLVLSRDWRSRDDVKASFHKVIEEDMSELDIALDDYRRTIIKASEEDWDYWSNENTLTANHLNALHIHAVKGREYEAVLLEIAPNKKPGKPHVLDDWEGKAESEALRVLYVGASRAKRLLVIAINQRRSVQLKKIFEANNIDAEFINEA